MRRRNLIILALLLGLLGLEILIMAPGDLGLSSNETHSGSPVASTGGGPQQVMHDLHLVEAKPEGKEWELWAKKAMKTADDPAWNIEDVSVKFFTATGFYTVTGKRGRVTPNKDMRIAGDVVTKSSNGYEFRTQSAVYDSEKKRLVSPSEVQMTGPPDVDGGALTLTGSEMLVDVVTSEMTIGRDVHARKKIKGDRTAVIVSRRAIFSGKSNQARFIGDVVIDVDTLRITGPQAKFSYKPGTDFIESMEVEGGAKVTDLDKMATSDTVSVKFDTEKIVFKGKPHLVQNGDELFGEEIVFLDGGKKVQVNNSKPKDDASSRRVSP